MPMLTLTVPGVVVPLIHATSAPEPTAAVLTAAIQAAGLSALTLLALPHPAAVWTEVEIAVVVLSYQPATTFVPLGVRTRSTGDEPTSTAVAAVHVPPAGRVLAFIWPESDQSN